MSESSTERKEIFPFFRFDVLFLSVTIHYKRKVQRRKRKISVFDINMGVLRVPVGILHFHLGIGRSRWYIWKTNNSYRNEFADELGTATYQYAPLTFLNLRNLEEEAIRMLLEKPW